jgi:hypothetical protein
MKSALISIFIVILVVIIAVLGVLLYLQSQSMTKPSLSAPVIEMITTPTTVKVTGPVILSAIRNDAKLETITMVIANDQDITKEWGVNGACKEDLTYLGYFTVTAGVDLQDIPQADVALDGDGNPATTNVTLILPPADIMHVELDTKRSRIVHSNVSILPQVCGTKLPEMVTEAQKDIRDLAEKTARDQNIISMAEDRASFELKKLLVKFGFSRVTIKFISTSGD